MGSPFIISRIERKGCEEWEHLPDSAGESHSEELKLSVEECTHCQGDLVVEQSRVANSLSSCPFISCWGFLSANHSWKPGTREFGWCNLQRSASKGTEWVRKGREWIHWTNGDNPAHKPTLSGSEVSAISIVTPFLGLMILSTVFWTYHLRKFLVLVCCFL